MRPIITVEHLRKVYRVGNEKVVALNVYCSWRLARARCAVLWAPLARENLRFLEPACRAGSWATRGRVLIGRHEISAMTEDELALFRQQHLGFIFQSYSLLPSLTAAENVALPLMWKGVPERQREKIARQ